MGKHSDKRPTKVEVRSEIDSEFERFCNDSYAHYMSNVKLGGFAPDLEHRILVQSIQGNARSGHVGFFVPSGEFNFSYQYPNAGIYDVFKAVSKDPQRILESTERELDIMADYNFSCIDALASSASGETRPIIELPPRQERMMKKLLGDRVAGGLRRDDVKRWVQGNVLFSRGDTVEWRSKAEEVFGNRIPAMHKGEVKAIDMQKLAEQHLQLEHLESGAYLKRLGLERGREPSYYHDTLVERGVIRTDSSTDRIVRDDNLRTGFVEVSSGSGTSDDCSLLYVGTRLGLVGLLAGDQNDRKDTLEKCSKTIVNGGYDAHHGRELEQYYEARMGEEFPLADEDALAMIYVSAKGQPLRKVSSSQRYFHQTRNGNLRQRAPILTHALLLGYLRNENRFPAEQPLGFEKQSSNQLHKRFIHSLEQGIRDGVFADPSNQLGNGKRKLYDTQPLLDVKSFAA